MKRIRVLLSIIIVIILITNNTGAGASDIVVRSTHIGSFSISFSIDGSGNALCGCSIIGKSGTTGITGGLLLYKINSGGTRTLINTWRIGTKSDFVFISEPYKVTKRGKYTLVLNANVFRNGGSESICVDKSDTY